MLIAQVVQTIDLLPPGEKAFLTGWSIDSRGDYLYIPIPNTNRIRAFRLIDHDRLEEDTPEWHTDFVPVCLKVIWDERARREYLFVADKGGEAYYPETSKFLGRHFGKWVPPLPQPPLLKTALKAGAEIKIWQFASFAPEGEQTKVFALGGCNDREIGGFVQIFDLTNEGATIGATIPKIDEAPYDVAFHDGRFFIASGRAGHIEVRLTHQPYDLKGKITSSVRSFTPTKLAVATRRRQLWAASYGTLFWSDLDSGQVKGSVEVAPGVDCIGDFALADDESTIYATCIYSSRLCEVDLGTLYVREVPMIGGSLERPCSMIALDSKIIVLGHTNGKLWVIKLTAT